jgi:hypothetical protein
VLWFVFIYLITPFPTFPHGGRGFYISPLGENERGYAIKKSKDSINKILEYDNQKNTNTLVSNKYKGYHKVTQRIYILILYLLQFKSN